jgi:hypothetical protein
MDPFVQLSDGLCTNTVEHWLELIDEADPTEYTLSVDAQGRFLIHEIDISGYRMNQPAFVENKWLPYRTRSLDFPISFAAKTTTHRYA